MKYRIETTDGVVIRKRATRPYIVALVLRKNGKVVNSGAMSINALNKRTAEWYYENGYQLEQVVAVPL